MRVLIYTHAFAPKAGGVETYVMLLAQGLARDSAKNDVQVTVVTPTPVGTWDDGALPFRVVRQPTVAALGAMIRKADAIHLAGPTLLPMVLGMLFRKPVVVEHDGYQACCPNGLLFDERTKTVCLGQFMADRYRECLGCNAANEGFWKSLRLLLLTFPRRWLCARMAANIAPSSHVARRVALPRTININHGVAGSKCHPRCADPKQTLPFQFAYVGRLVREKGVPVLLSAARKLAQRGCDFRLTIIGDGPEKLNLERTAYSYGLQTRVVFAGARHGEALQEILREMPVAIMPSVWEDVAPLAAAEHMMDGRLLIASDIGGLGEMVDGSGLKFAAGDAQALASCMQRVLDEPGLAETLGEKARHHALQFFAQDRMVAEHLAVYQGLAVAGRGAQ
jgi:glycogen(starch) synthase